MLILYAKYTLLMCLAIISDNSNCEEKLNEASISGGVYWKAACTAKCLLFEKNKNLLNCIDWCQLKEPSNSEIILKKINENHDLILLCRDDRSITLKVIVPSKGYNLQQHHQLSVDSTPFSNKEGVFLWAKSNVTQEIYIINISLAHEAKDISVYLSNENLITIGNLNQNTTYNVSVAVVYSTDEYSIIAKGRQFDTLRRGYKPKEIQEISLLEFAADESDEMRLSALISWKPSYDKTCRYHLICYSPEREDMEVTPIEIRDPQRLYTYNLDNLTFATVYNVGIRAMNTNDSSKESELKWDKIITPSCIQWHNNNFNICAPLKPEGLTAEEHFLIPDVFSLNISWQHPKYEPDYYTLRVLDLDHLHTYKAKQYDYNISKDQSWFFIPNITLKGMLFETHLTAHTPGGNSAAVITQSTNKPHLVSVSPDRNYGLKLFIAILAPIFCILILSLTIFVVCHRRAKLKRFQERCKYFEELEKKAPIDPKSTFEFPTKKLTLPTSQDDIHQFQLDLEEKLFFNDDMEVNSSDVKLYEVLGEGAFGLVRRGIFHDSKKDMVDGGNVKEVAVKMLKDQPSVDDVRAFRREIEVMKSVGRHPNIVGIIGHCTKKCNEMLLLTEYCSFGNLLNFLRNEWKYLHELSFRTMTDPLKISEQFQKQQKQQQCSMSPTKPKKLTENEFKFNSKIAEKITMKYKNINSTTSSNVSAPNPVNGVISLPLAPPPPPPVPSAMADATKSGSSHQNQIQQQPHPEFQRLVKFNKSYGYEEICTNACKCRVDILAACDTRPTGDNTTKSDVQKCGQIIISKKCECKLKRSKLHSIDNEGYYKNLVAQSSAAAGVVKEEGANGEAKGSIAAKREPLRATDLLEIAKQVAMGMEFLSKNKVVHRDLAARNVLVSSDRTVKIADFGLSRDVYQENVYKKTGNGKLPIKWLALESMTHQVYTSQSDVWSFGILLYEIITLGGIPYPSIPTNRLLHLLKTGYRMEKPKNCGQGFYNLMTACWNFNPAERPNFTEIIKILDSLLSESPQLPFEKITPSTTRKEENSPETPSSDDSYLKPL